MRIRYFVIFYTICMLFGMVFMGDSYSDLPYIRKDMVFYNEQRKQVEAEIKKGIAIDRIQKEYACDILMLEDDEYELQLNEWIGNGAIIFDYYEDEELVGKIVWNDNQKDYQSMQKSLFHRMITIWITILIAGYILLLLIYSYFMKPFGQLQNFAAQIAKGNLDYPLPAGKHNFFGAFTESFDIMREELSRAKEREYQANRSKKELVAELSHDIKTPVSTIKATCEVMQVKEQNTDTLEKIEIIAAKADMIDHLIGNLFHATMEELEALKVEVAEESSLYIEKMISDLRYYGEIHMEGAIPECLVYMDKIRLEQVINNIINNSYKYAKTEIHVQFKEMAEGICIKIEDTGNGVSDEELPLITEKFYRGSNKKGNAGSGLGLYLAKMFMEQMLGSLECYNENGFVVELYLKKV